jgi:hypothetical protein
MPFLPAKTLSWFVLALAVTTNIVQAAEESADAAAADTCGLYLAVSSTSTVEEPKWGIYAGKEYPRGVSIGSGEVAIQTFNLMANVVPLELEDDEDEDEQEDLTPVVDFFEQFIWVPQASGGQFELKEGRTVTAIPGVGVLGAYNPKLTNTDWNHSASFFRPVMNEEPGVAHPGRGAYSNFYNVAMRSKEPIREGMEIFISYGDNWDAEKAEEDDDEEDGQITREDYGKIDETVNKMIAFFTKHEADLPPDAKADIYNFLIRDVMAAAAGPKKGAKIATMLPGTPEELTKVKEAGGALTYSQPTSVRTLEWLSTYGRCMDNIKAGPSTIPHAGRGAFATRTIPNGGLVAPVPLVHIIDEGIMDMHEVEKVTDPDEGDIYARKNDEVTGKQLLLNYCFGHAESTMLFFNGGAATALINHASGDKANAKLTWSTHPNHHKHWYELTPIELLEPENQHIGLLMEIVATREIAEGEEVLLDYGNEWQAAWDAHVKTWTNKVTSGALPSNWPLHALDYMAAQKESGKPWDPTTPLPENVMLKCFLMANKPTDEPPVNDKGEKVRLWSESEDPKRTVFDQEYLFDCKIEQLQEPAEADGSYLYTVVWEKGGSRTIVKNVPHAALVLVDKPGTSDQFVTEAFRHYIPIPDDVFPQGPWRDAA